MYFTIVFSNCLQYLHVYCISRLLLADIERNLRKWTLLLNEFFWQALWLIVTGLSHYLQWTRVTQKPWNAMGVIVFGLLLSLVGLRPSLNFMGLSLSFFVVFNLASFRCMSRLTFLCDSSRFLSLNPKHVGVLTIFMKVIYCLVVWIVIDIITNWCFTV